MTDKTVPEVPAFIKEAFEVRLPTTREDAWSSIMEELRVGTAGQSHLKSPYFNTNGILSWLDSFIRHDVCRTIPVRSLNIFLSSLILV